MSYTNNSNVDTYRNTLSMEDYFLAEKLKIPAAWYAPNINADRDPNGNIIHPQTIHVGGQGKPTWEEPVWHVGRQKEAEEAYRKGSKNLDQAMYSPLCYDSRWEELFKIRADMLKYGKSYIDSPFRQASGVITSGDFPLLNVIQLLSDVLGTDNRTYTLDQAVTHVATPNLIMHVDQWSGLTGSLRVGEGVEPLVKKGAFARTEYMLQKMGIAIASTDEGMMRYDRDVWGQHVTGMNDALRREVNQLIATELETATDIAKGDWLAWTTDHRTRDASRDIYDAASVIRANGGNPDTIASHTRVFNDFMTNTGGPLGASQQQRFMPGVVNVPLLQNFTWYLDDLKTATLATVYDKSAVQFMEGPTKSEQWRMPGPGINRYQIVQFNQCKIIDATRIRDITAVSA